MTRYTRNGEYGIPTLYNGTQFRSRAEARWAAFFDFAGWEWDYEPIDLDGYIPDFVLRWYKPLLVEVKGGALDLADLRPHVEKIETSSWPGEALILAATPERGGGIGMIAERWEVDTWYWSRAVTFRCDSCFQSTVKSSSGSYTCRRCGGGTRLDDRWSPSRDWSDACNATQWMRGATVWPTR